MMIAGFCLGVLATMWWQMLHVQSPWLRDRNPNVLKNLSCVAQNGIDGNIMRLNLCACSHLFLTVFFYLVAYIFGKISRFKLGVMAWRKYDVCTYGWFPYNLSPFLLCICRKSFLSSKCQSILILIRTASIQKHF